MLAPSQADDVPRAQGSLSHLGDSSPKGRAKASYIGTRNGAYLYRYAPFTVLRLPLNARAARKSDGRKTVSVPALPLPLPVGGGRAQRGRRGQITATSNRKMLAPSQADDVPRAQGSQSPQVTALPKGEPRHRILAQEMERICIDTLHSLFYGYPQCARAARKSDGRKTVSVPAPLASPCGRGGRAQRGRRGQITATSNRKMLAPSQADDVPRAQGSLSHLGDSSPKGRAKASYIGTRNGAYLYRYAPFTVLRLPSMRVPPESRMVVKRFPSRHFLPLPVGEVAERSEDGEGK